MRTLTVTAALVTALSGTGCIVSSTDQPVGDADIAWQFRGSNGQVEGNFTTGFTGCGAQGDPQAAISHVLLTVWDAFGRVVLNGVSYPCVDNTGYPRAFVSGLPTGHYTYVAQAWRVDAPVFDNDFTPRDSFDVFANQVSTVDATLDVLPTAPLTVYFTQNGAFTCSGTPQVRLDIFFPATSGTLLEPSTTIPCATSNFGYTATLDQPTGVAYGYDIFALDVGGASVNENCLQSVVHTGIPAVIDLLPAPQASCGP
jgi:hypothetical protein